MDIQKSSSRMVKNGPCQPTERYKTKQAKEAPGEVKRKGIQVQAPCRIGHGLWKTNIRGRGENNGGTGEPSSQKEIHGHRKFSGKFTSNVKLCVLVNLSCRRKWIAFCRKSKKIKTYCLQVIKYFLQIMCNHFIRIN